MPTVSVVRPSLLLIALAYIGFVSLGLPDAVIGVAWPSVRDRFHLQQGSVGLVFIASGVGYFVSSFLSGRLSQRLGIGLLLASSTAVVATAMLGFGFSPVWPLFVVCGTVHGLGSGAIDAGLNGYAAHSLSSRHMNWLHACYCLGAMLGPLLMTAVLAGGRDYYVGYAVVGTVMSVLAIVFLTTRPRWGTASTTAEYDGARVTTLDTLRHPAVVVSMLLFFFYTGLEVSFSQWTYTVLTESRGVSHTTAGIAVGFFWGCLGMGRVVFGLIADQVGLDRLVRSCLFAAAAGALLFALPLGVAAAFAGLALAGIGLAPVFPCLMTRTPQRLGTGLATHAIGFQVGSAMIGAAAVPGALGYVAGRSGLQAVTLGIVIVAAIVCLLHEVLLRRDAAAWAERG
jgi:fucose permease